MPNKNVKMKIPRAFDNRVHVDAEMAENMRAMYRDGASLHAISREFGVDRKTVKRYVIPGYREALYADYKSRKPWIEYYDREVRRKYMRDHRKHKRELELAGKLTS